MNTRQPTLLDLRSLDGNRVQRTPFPHAVVDDVFRAIAAARDLAAHFPTEGYRSLHAEREDKRFNLSALPLIEKGTAKINPALDRCWHGLAAELLSPEYRDRVATMFNLDLAGTAIEAVLYRGSRDNYIDPHTDKPEKFATQLIYFGDEAWREEWGGEFAILGSRDPADVVRRVLPRLGVSVIFRRSDSSWHAHSPCAPDAPERRVLQISFSDPSMRYAEELLV